MPRLDALFLSAFRFVVRIFVYVPQQKERERERDVVVDVDDLYDIIVCVNRMHIRITYPTYL